MKKAFTLLELLAVIVILGILVVLVVPKVTDIIETAKIKTYKSNEEVVIKSTKNYLTLNEKLLPKEIGETTEITFEQLQNEKYMNQITDSDGICDGYILVTKTEEDYEYKPEIKCGDANLISNNLEDGLVAYYDFDNFAESTENILTLNQSSLEEGNTDGWRDGVSNYSWEVANYEVSKDFAYEGEYSLKITTSGIKTLEGVGMYSISCEADLPYTLSMYVKLPINKGFKLIAGTTIDSTVKTLGYKTIIGNGEWQRVFITIKEGENPCDYDLRWAFISLENESVNYYIDAVQVEQKNYTTEFVKGIRNDFAQDYSTNNNSLIMGTLSAPKWIENNNNGYYYFNGINQFLNSTYIKGINNEGLTILSWIYPASLSGRFEISNQYQWDGGPWTGWSFRLMYDSIYIKLGDNSNTIYSCCGGKVEINKWQLLTATWNGEKINLYLNGEQVKQCELALNYVGNYGTHTVGKYAGSAYYFKGGLDELKIYNRALSEEEIKYDYDMNKYKYE